MLYELCLKCGQFRFVPGMYCLDCGYIPPKLPDSDCVFRRMFSQPTTGEEIISGGRRLDSGEK
jgi:hypothetical protein